MKSETPKVLFGVNDEPLCFGALKALFESCEQVVVVVGYRGPDVREKLLQRAQEVFAREEIEKKLSFFTQDPPRGTGDAVLVALNGLGKQVSHSTGIVVANGDMPLLRAQTVKHLLKICKNRELDSACVSVRVSNPKGLGRILRDDKGVFAGIREEKDADATEKKIREINGGLYFFRTQFLLDHIRALDSNNEQGEFYLTDLLGQRESHIRSEALPARNPFDLMGVNTTFELARVRRIAQKRLKKKLCEEHGVDFLDLDSAVVSARAKFDGDAEIGPNVLIKGACRFGKGVRVEGHAYFENATIGDKAEILWGSVIREAQVGAQSAIGPMAHLRPGSETEEEVKVGNFVELKMTKMKKGSKASHLTYLGDAEIGEESNIGCGTITCNYDGVRKHRTVVGRRAFIGSDTQLIAPVQVGDNAYIGSGTTVTQDIPEGALALSRAEMVIKPGYAQRLSERLAHEKKDKAKEK